MENQTIIDTKPGEFDRMVAEMSENVVVSLSPFMRKVLIVSTAILAALLGIAIH
ncbi:MAG: hypothetical protein KC931_22225 [Candidatus Omnitrophica bacterium]|nr:hypothetical protein [Candidatus Omnitrophota bacterium]